MKPHIRNAIWAIFTIATVLGVALSLRAQDRTPAPISGPRYTVVTTDGLRLVVTDNRAQMVYFYALDKTGKPGDPLKLRGTLPLGDVGKPTLSLKTHR